MANVATLGIAIDSRSAVSAKKALDDLAASAKPAARAAQDLQKATTGAASGATNLSKAIKPAQEAAAGLAKQGQLARHELINLSRQVQDVGVSLASGQSPFTVLIQQGTQIADIFGSSRTGTVGGAVRQIGTGIASVMTPMRILGLGVAATGAAAYAAYGFWKSFALQLDDTARSAGTTTQSMAALQAAASFKGISTEEFSKGMAQFGRSVYDARNNMGGLADLLRANGMHATSFEDAIANAANLIKNARSDQQALVLLQQMGLPATMDWVRLLSQGSDGLDKAKAAAVAFGGAANDNLVKKAREFDEAWNRIWTNFGLYSRAAIATAASGITGLFSGVNPAQMFGGQATERPSTRVIITGGTTEPPPKTTQDPNALKNQIAIEQQRLGILGQTATVQQQVRAVELQIQSARLNGVPISKAEEAALKNVTAAQALGITQIQAATDAMRVEAATIGMSVGDATAYAAQWNAINEARRAGRELTPENIAQIKREAAVLGEAAAQADSLRWQYENLVRGPLQTFTSALQNGSNAWDAFKKAGQSALNSIASKLIDMAAQNLWKSAFGGSNGGGLGLFGSLFGGGSGSTPTLSTGLGAGTGGIPFLTFDSGGFTGMGGKYEPAGIVHKGEYVFDAASTRRIGVGNLERLRGYADGGIVDSMPRLSMPGRASNDNSRGGSAINVTIPINIDATGADAAALQRTNDQLERLRAEIPTLVVDSVVKAKKRGALK